MTRVQAKSLGFEAIDPGTALWSTPWPSMHEHSRRHLGGLRRLLGSVLRWLADGPVRLDREAEADRLMRRWGDLAPDVARAMASRESAGLFDEAETGFWSEVAGEIERRREERSSPQAENDRSR